MSEATDPEALQPRPPRRGKGRRLALRGGLLLLALLVLFHQPLLRAGVERMAIRLAARQNIRLSVDVQGSVWTHLTLKNLRADSTGSSPVDSISIEWLRVDYNLWTLLRRGLRASLTSYQLRNAKLVLDPVKGNEDQRKKLAHALHDILEQPAMYSDRAQVENFNLTILASEGTYEFKDIHALLDPVHTGYLRVGELTIPNIGYWHDLHTQTTFLNRHLILRDFSLGEEVRVDRLELDASGREKGISYLSFQGTVLGGDLGFFLWRREWASGEVSARLSAFLSGMSLEALDKYAGWKIPVTGNVRSVWVQMIGDPNIPAHWEGQVTAEVEKGTVAGFAVDEASGKVSVRNGILRFDALECATGQNRLTFQAERRLAENFDIFHWHGLEATFTLDAPELSALRAGLTEGRVQGKGSLHFQEESVAVEGSVTASGVRGKDFGIEAGRADFQASHRLYPKGGGGRPWYEGFAGQTHLEASALHFREFAANRLLLDVPMTGDAARHAKLTLDLNGKDKLEGEADFSLHEPFAYEARLVGSVRDITLFQPFFPMPLGGALQIDWHGTGQIALMRHIGEGRVALQHGQMGTLTGMEGELAGIYSPESIDISALRVRCDQGTFQAGVRLRNQRLQVEGLRLTTGQVGTVTGSFSLPLDLRTPTRPETVFPLSGALQGMLTLEQEDLAKVFPATRPGLAVRGAVTGSLTAGGTLKSPDLIAKLDARNLQSDATAKLAPASGDATLLFKNGQLALSGSLAQPGLSPMLFKGSLPMDLRKTLTEGRIAPATPIAFSIKLPPSPAGIFAPFLPGVRFLEGRLSVDASANGTLEKPVLNGGVMLDLTAIRFLNADLPGINHFQADLRFAGSELTVQRFTGDVAGGPFSVTGRLRLDSLTAPVLDLRLQSEGTLLVRNDTLTLRANSDLRIAGPVAQARVSGKIGFTKSRFFREVEILPIGLPGHPAPKSANNGFDLSTEIAPFRNWTYDVTVQTDEPFVVKGNLANGTIEGNLHLGGTGFAPTLEGTAHIDNFIASLPFSQLTVDRGALYYSGNAFLNPKLDIHGSSRIRDYNVNVYLYGTASEPQTLFTSEPALPQEEIIALLASGATNRDFSQNNQALTGRAAVLLFQDIYRKIFPRRPPLPHDANPMDRFLLDVGGVDPRTGKQELMGRFKLSDHYQIGAGVDLQGDMRMQLQYLIRFK